MEIKYSDIFKNFGQTSTALVLDVLLEVGYLYPHQVCDAKIGDRRPLGYGDRRVREAEVREALEFLESIDLVYEADGKYSISGMGFNIISHINGED